MYCVGYPSVERVPFVSYSCFAVLLDFTPGAPARYTLRPEYDAGTPTDAWFLDTRCTVPFHIAHFTIIQSVHSNYSQIGYCS